jgi:hypothetical protein
MLYGYNVGCWCSNEEVAGMHFHRETAGYRSIDKKTKTSGEN